MSLQTPRRSDCQITLSHALLIATFEGHTWGATRYNHNRRLGVFLETLKMTIEEVALLQTVALQPHT